MSYRVIYTDTVTDAIEKQVIYFKDQEIPPHRIATWLNKLLDTIDSLEEMPIRYPIAPVETRAKGIEIRRLIFGDYLIFFTIDQHQQIVQVLSFYHGSQRYAD